MFNTLIEQLFACQSLLKEQRQPPTGGLFEAMEESLGRGFPHPLPLLWGRKRPLEPLKFGFPLPEENDWLLLWEELPPKGCFLYDPFLCRNHERAYSERVRNPESLLKCLFEKEVLTFLDHLRLEQGTWPKGRIPKFLASRFT